MAHQHRDQYRLRLLNRNGRRLPERHTVRAELDIHDDEHLRTWLVQLVREHFAEGHDPRKWVTEYGLEVISSKRDEVLRTFRVLDED